MRESTIEAYLKRRVKDAGGLARKWVSPGRTSVPDQIVMFPGARISFVELKAPGKKPTPAQVREHTFLRNCGFTVHVLDSHEAVDEFIKWRTS